MPTLRLLAITLALVLAACLAPSARAGTYKRIAIDGSFGDWAGVPAAYNDPSETTSGADFNRVFIANDDQYLYIRFSLYAPDSPFTSRNNIFLDTDNNASTGFHPLGRANLGSEILIQSGTGYQERGGGFNEGGITGLGWSASPAGRGTDFELRIARAATFAVDGAPVFAGDTVAVVLESENSSFVAVDTAPGVEDRLTYTFASPPEPFVGRRPLLSLTGTPWRVNDSGSDPGVGWTEAAYDDTQPEWRSGTGLFGFSAAAGVYPAPLATPLAASRSTVYFRTRFDWANDPAGVVLVTSNYLSDGAVLYLNGVEAKRLRLPAGALGFPTPASGGPSPKGQAELVGLSASSLLVGENVLAVEIHQSAGDNSDLVFGLSLTAASEVPIVFVDPTQPADRTVVAGQRTVFTAEWIGSAPVTYQWFKDGQPLSGANGATLVLDPVLAADAGAYQLKASNPVSSDVVSRLAVLTVTGTPVAIIDPAQPADQTIVEGQSVTLTVTAEGSAPLSYQWFKGADAVPEATAASYTIPSVRSADAGLYHVVVRNPLPSSASSRTARLTVAADRTPPSILGVAASLNRVVITFSEPVDETSAGLSGNYVLGGGLSVMGAARSPANTAEVVLTTSPQTFGVFSCLTVSAVRDLFANPILPNTTVSFVSTIQIDGSFDDWAGVPIAYQDGVDLPTATDYESVAITNDATHLFVRVTLHAPSDLGIFYNNIFVDGDNNTGTGYPFRVGSEMLIQGGGGYQQKQGGFNEGGINDLDWAIEPAGVGTSFEFRIARRASFASDGLPVITSPVIGLVFDAEDTSFHTVDTVPDAGVLTYTLFDAPSPTLGPLRAERDQLGDLRIYWSGPGVLQSRASLAPGPWETVWDLPAPYVLGPPAGSAFYRLVLPCP